MARRMLIAPIAGILTAAAGIGVILGVRTGNTTETEVIERVVAQYLEDAGSEADPSDCAARPAVSEGLWLLVVCDRRGSAHYEFFVDRHGRLADANVAETSS